LKASDAGVTARLPIVAAAEPALTVNVTVTAGADAHALLAALIDPEYEPAPRPAGFTETVSAAGVVPARGPIESQA